LRNVIRGVDRNLPIAQVRSMLAWVDASFGQTRLSTALFTLFGVLGLALAAVGLYGVMTYAVQQRRHEIGVRLALGAQPSDVVVMIVRGGAALVGTGIVIGFAGSWALTRLMTKLLFNVSPTDGVTFATIAATLAGVALAAAYLPGRRATRVDPVAVLR